MLLENACETSAGKHGEDISGVGRRVKSAHVEFHPEQSLKATARDDLIPILRG